MSDNKVLPLRNNDTEETFVPTQVDWIREHAIKIAALLEAPARNDLMNVRIWRALYLTRTGVIAASIHIMKGNPPFAQIQQRFSMGAYQPAQQISGPAMTATEMAVFLGLDDVPPESIKWVEQNFDTKGIAVVHDRLDNMKLTRN